MKQIGPSVILVLTEQLSLSIIFMLFVVDVLYYRARVHVCAVMRHLIPRVLYGHFKSLTTLL